MIIGLMELSIQVEKGEADPLKAYAHAKSLAAANAHAFKIIEQAAIEEAEKYEKSFEYHGIKFEKRNGSKRYSQSHVKEWQEKSLELKAIEGRLKAAYNASQLNLTSVTSDGEVMELPTITVGKDSLIVKK